MALSVIVTSYESPGTLERCLQSLSQQNEATHIIVKDCSRVNPAGHLRIAFPTVWFQHFDTPQSVPILRWTPSHLPPSDIVAFTEARCVPSPTWCGDLIAAHQAYPDARAIGGIVALREPADRFSQAVYLVEYSAFAPPMRTGAVKSISGANFSYIREAFEEAGQSPGEWETALHQRWADEGKMLWQSEARVTFENSMSIPQGIRQRVHYGRGYAADRVRGASVVKRVGFAFVSLALPALLLVRIARDCSRKGLLRVLLPSLGWTVVLVIAWSWGETAGYLFGKSSGARIF